MKSLPKILLLPLVALVASCDLFNVEDSEGTRGRGAKAFDPYSSSASGAISLSLMAFNGCAILPNGEPVTRGDLDPATFPYPDQCEFLNDGFFGLGPSRPPSARLTLVRNSLYFLRELSLMDALVNSAHMNFADKQAPATWMRKHSRFKSLDWSGLTVGRENWKSLGFGSFQREVFYENAAWMLSNDDTLKVEVIDAGGTIRTTQTYGRQEFLAENPVTGRTRASWMTTGVGAPRFPGDTEPQPGSYNPPVYHTGVKVSFANSTNPFKTFRTPDISGEGAIRVTWSLMPDEPFLFPVTFVSEQDRESTCYELDADGLATDKAVPCGFGLEQQLRINKPGNGKYFLPGDTLDLLVSLQDGDGHGLHPRDLMPSWNDFMGGSSNGLGYFNDRMLLNFRDTSSTESGFKVVGPLQDLKTVYGTYSLPYFSYPVSGEPQFYVTPGMPDAFPGYAAAKQPTRYSVKLSDDAKPGTYMVMLKGHRAVDGERLNRLDSFFFQVGQEAPTTYPGRVGNCQSCHNGVNSLDNLHHGMSVDNVEACKTCHFEPQVGHVSDFMHRMHMSSRKYKQSKSDCTFCHLTRESAVRPSLVACNSCHINSHGTEYFDVLYEDLQNTPNAYGNCANACHGVTPPTGHILPTK
ncbi:hypothetical protein BO221_41485 [Archangium sp. Cb G35]|uniref:hypothetical protein n=1 Tax=Archangium sp. Cb G35 TaxID=1920190 RepID=UPI000937468D|nr:hypothetical protein [Archangium sp. Cb G35]OJT18528.1 hypothetical protein BO221_41485 [Archangium sp. Cb G35]